VSDPYLDASSGVLRNRLGLTDEAELQEAETKLSMVRDVQIARETVPGRYDFAHLRRFHRRLFSDVYPWAGKVRTVDIAKEGTYFCAAVHIESYATETVFPKMREHDFLRGLDHQQTVDALAELLGDVNALHPFREGNGRTQRAFFRQMASAAGWRLDLSALSAEENIVASAAAMAGNFEPMAAMLGPALTRL
jgi:cell filamentation protein